MKSKRMTLVFMKDNVQVYKDMEKHIKERKKQGITDNLFKSSYIIEAIKFKLKNQ